MKRDERPASYHISLIAFHASGFAMTRKIAATSALLVFAIAILLGIGAENTFATTLSRALVAMAGTFVIGLVIGAMADRMIAERASANLSAAGKKLENSEAKPAADDR
jgi:hypothetical protein